MSKSDTELSVPQAARKLGFTLGWVYSMVYTGKLRATKTAGRWRIPADEVAARLEKRKERE